MNKYVKSLEREHHLHKAARHLQQAGKPMTAETLRIEAEQERAWRKEHYPFAAGVTQHGGVAATTEHSVDWKE